MEGTRRVVFETVEILENILLFLPAKELFGVQCVSSLFRDIVTTSPSIQDKLFLQLRNEPRETWMLNDHEAEPRWWKRDYVSKRRFTSWTNGEKTEGSLFTPVQLNPLLSNTCSQKYPVATGRLSSVNLECLSLEFQMPLCLKDSWMDTYVSDPPCLKVQMQVDFAVPTDPEHTGSAKKTFESDRPLTIGEMLEGILSAEDSLWWLNGPSWPKQTGRPLKEMIGELERSTGQKAMVQCPFGDRALFVLFGVVVPSEEDRKRVRTRIETNTEN